jgi:maltooligosyltrehalose trehalohydrolase
MLFAGDEFAATSPFLYFADHEPELARLVREGRARFLTQFASLADPAAQAALHDPADVAAFKRCRLSQAERNRHAAAVRLHRDLIAMRKEGMGLNEKERARAEALTDEAFLVRAGDLLLIVNLGGDLELTPRLSPLLRASRGRCWTFRWSSDDVAYDGPGIPEPARAGRLSPGHSAVLLVGSRPGTGS